MSEGRVDVNAGKRRSMRIVIATLASSLISLPFAWLLSFLAFHFLGLFFFTLAGLIFGSLAYRWALPSAPVSRRVAVAMSSVIVLVCWFTSIVVESRALPGQVAERQLVIPELPDGMTRDSYLESQRNFAAERLKAEAWPGGVVGYARWVIADGELDLSQGSGPVKRFVAGQRYWWWVGRVLFSITLLAFGVHSQVKGLVAKAKSQDSLGSSEQPLTSAEPTSTESPAAVTT